MFIYFIQTQFLFNFCKAKSVSVGQKPIFNNNKTCKQASNASILRSSSWNHMFSHLIADRVEFRFARWNWQFVESISVLFLLFAVSVIVFTNTRTESSWHSSNHHWRKHPQNKRQYIETVLQPGNYNTFDRRFIIPVALFQQRHTHLAQHQVPSRDTQIGRIGCAAGSVGCPRLTSPPVTGTINIKLWIKKHLL